jgi:hypothetical protein
MCGKITMRRIQPEDLREEVSEGWRKLHKKELHSLRYQESLKGELEMDDNNIKIDIKMV